MSTPDDSDEGATPWALSITQVKALPVEERTSVILGMVLEQMRSERRLIRHVREQYVEHQASRTQRVQVVTELLALLRSLVGHRLALTVYCIVALTWGLGLAAWATGIDPSVGFKLLPEVTIGGSPSGTDKAVQP